MYFSFFSVLSFLIWNFAVVKCSYLMRYSSNLSDLLSFHTLYNITGVLMILLCCHWCPDGSARVSLVEYSSSSPRYLIIQYLNNLKKYPQKSIAFSSFSYSSSLRTCSPLYRIILGPRSLIIQNPNFNFLLILRVALTV